jgi:S-formylglutathione hydrolase FrmB
VPDAFMASESSPQWEAVVYKRMVAEYYLSGNIRLHGALHGHFVDLYTAFKLAICNLSLSGYSKKRPTSYERGNYDVEDYLDALNNLLQSYVRKYHTKKWWSRDVVEKIFPLHLAYTTEVSGDQ